MCNYTRVRQVSVVVSLVAAAATFAPNAASQRRGPGGRISIGGREAVADEVLVRFVDRFDAAATGGNAAGHDDVDRQVDADESEAIAPQLRRLRSRSFDAVTLLNYLRNHPDVAYAEPNYIVRAATTPNDPRFPSLWGLLNNGQTIEGSAGIAGADIHATKAWSITTGSRANVVAVIDSGMDYTHHDLANNVWTAPASFTVTIGGQAIRCSAGTHGFNVLKKNCDPQDDFDHGTHVAGTIGATGNNLSGVTGVNWKASVMAAKFLDANGNGTVADAITAIEFTIQAKKALAATSGANVRVLTNSWSGGGYSQALLDEIQKANSNGMLFVAAAGNEGTNIGASPAYPASYKASNVLAVAASTNQDQLADFSNYGSTVPLAAPGVDIMSTVPGGYRQMSGTSMAAPHVAGAAALVLAKCALDTARLRAAIVDNVDRVGALTGWVSSGGRLNVDKAVRSCAAPAAIDGSLAAPTGLRGVSAPGAGQVTLSWGASAAATGYNVKRSWTDGGPYKTVATVTGTSYVYNGTSGRQYFFVVSAINAMAESANSAQVAAIGK